MNTLAEVAAYCAANIEDWGEKKELALAMIGRRMPIDYSLRNEIEDAVCEWCDDNEVSVDFFEDWEKVAEEIVLWEE